MIIKYVRLEKKTGNSVFQRSVAIRDRDVLSWGGGGISFQVLPPETFEQSSHLSTHPFSNRFTNLFILCFSTFSRRRLSLSRGEKKKKKRKHTKRVATPRTTSGRVNNGGRDGRSIDCRQVTRALYIYENIKKKKKKKKEEKKKRKKNEEFKCSHIRIHILRNTQRLNKIGKREEEKEKKKRKRKKKERRISFENVSCSFDRKIGYV